MSQRLKILSYNMHKGVHWLKRSPALSEMKEALAQTQADLVCLQEVVGDSRHGLTTSQFEFLADRLWDHFAYGKNAVFDELHHGNAILSRYPIESFTNIDISQSWFEQRGILKATIRNPETGFRFQVFNLHFGLLTSWRKAQAQALLQILSQESFPLIAAGDFNDWDLKISKLLEKEGGYTEAFENLYARPAPTFPSFLPVFALDRVYLKGFKVVQAKCLRAPPWDQLSDHVPILCDLIWE